MTLESNGIGLIAFGSNLTHRPESFEDGCMSY